MRFQAPSIPGIDVGSESPRLPALARALRRLKEAEKGTDEEAVKAAVGELSSIARAWFQQHEWYYQEATECVANYYGAQWGYYDRNAGRFITNPEPRTNDQVRVVINVIAPIVDQATGIITKEPPIFDVSAATPEGRDSGAQQAGHYLLDHIWRHHRLDSHYRSSGRKTYLTGSDFLMWEWDETAGPPGRNASMSMDGLGSPAPSGDLRFTRLSHKDVAFDPCAKSGVSGEALIVRERWSRADLRSRHPMTWSSAEGGGSDADDETYSVRSAETYSPIAGRSAIDESRQDGEEVTRYTMFVPRNPDFPLGARVTFTDDTLLAPLAENPIYPKPGEPSRSWPSDPWPVFQITCDQRDENPWGKGRVVGMIGPQQAFNGVVSKSLQHIAKIANAKIILPKALDTEWTDEIGQEIRVNRMVQAGQISYVSPPQLPSEFFVAWDKLKVELEYMGGISASTNGQVPFADTSGRAMMAAQEQDYGRLKPVKMELDQVWARAMNFALRLFQRHADAQRQITIVGENGATSLAYFSKADLTAELDLRVLNDQSIPRDPAKKMLWLQSFMQMLAQAPDPQSRAALYRLAQIKDMEPLLETLQPDLVKARRMTDRIMLGETTPVFDGDDPLTFKTELERLAKTEEYENRVKRERDEVGISLTETLLMSAWTYYTQRAAAAMGGMMPPSAPVSPATTPQQVAA